jgi:hypothetical protein
MCIEYVYVMFCENIFMYHNVCWVCPLVSAFDIVQHNLIKWDYVISISKVTVTIMKVYLKYDVPRNNFIMCFKIILPLHVMKVIM